MDSISFEGEASGDCECFCWDVDEETYRKIVGEQEYWSEKDLREEAGWNTNNEPWRIYPNHIIKGLDKKDKSLKGEVRRAGASALDFGVGVVTSLVVEPVKFVGELVRSPIGTVKTIGKSVYKFATDPLTRQTAIEQFNIGIAARPGRTAGLITGEAIAPYATAKATSFAATKFKNVKVAVGSRLTGGKKLDAADVLSKDVH